MLAVTEEKLPSIASLVKSNTVFIETSNVGGLDVVAGREMTRTVDVDVTAASWPRVLGIASCWKINSREETSPPNRLNCSVYQGVLCSREVVVPVEASFS